VQHWSTLAPAHAPPGYVTRPLPSGLSSPQSCWLSAWSS
jgi:hypothetical protein